jgi:hypothetical protein
MNTRIAMREVKKPVFPGQVRGMNLPSGHPSPVPSKGYPVPEIDKSGPFAGSDTLVWRAQQDKFDKIQEELPDKSARKLQGFLR